MAERPDRHPVLVDGMNVIGSRPDGWWRDRDGAKRALFEGLRRLAERDGDAFLLVLDGRPLPDLPEGGHGGVGVLYARRGGTDAADDRIVEWLDSRPGPATVVTSDRTLRERAERRGARVEGASALRGRIDRVADG